jgi:acyl-CoA thioesterase FadM
LALQVSDLDYQIVKIKGTEEIICSKGKTVCIAVDYATGKPTAIPEEEKQKMLGFEQLAPNPKGLLTSISNVLSIK